jgi:hypothetical protein
MSTENGYSPAMPSSVSRSDYGNIVSSRDFDGYEGISKREYFAKAAMQGLLASGNYAADDDMCKEAWASADCMLGMQERMENLKAS